MDKLPCHTAVITGGTGAIGMALLRLLREKKCTVYVMLRADSPRANRIVEDDFVHIVPCDLQNIALLPEKIAQKADVFYHFAWENTVGAGRNDVDSQMRNIAYTLNAVHAAKALGCHTFIGAGSQAEYGGCDAPLRPETPAFPLTGYGIAKLCAGQMSRLACAQQNLRHIWARVVSVYGPYDGGGTLVSSILSALLAGDVPACTAGEQLWDYLYAADAADAFYRMGLYGKNGQVYVLGSGISAPLKEYILQMRDAVNPALAVALGKIPYPPHAMMRLQADITALTRDTGFVPKTDFNSGIRTTLNWMKEV
ncbi:MAG: NAD(P)-dependent oxidoreductase [Ruthenibacterium sp.]